MTKSTERRHLNNSKTREYRKEFWSSLKNCEIDPLTLTLIDESERINFTEQTDSPGNSTRSSTHCNPLPSSNQWCIGKVGQWTEWIALCR